jgi:hypothetical protein
MAGVPVTQYRRAPGLFVIRRRFSAICRKPRDIFGDILIFRHQGRQRLPVTRRGTMTQNATPGRALSVLGAGPIILGSLFLVDRLGGASGTSGIVAGVHRLQGRSRSCSRTTGRRRSRLLLHRGRLWVYACIEHLWGWTFWQRGRSSSSRGVAMVLRGLLNSRAPTGARNERRRGQHRVVFGV